MGRMSKHKVYLVKRYLIEEYSVIASSKQEAKKLAENPTKIHVIKETAKIVKHDPRATKGY